MPLPVTDVERELKKMGAESLVRERTGLVIDPYFSGTKIGWLLDNVRGARARVFGGTGVTYYWPTGRLRVDGNIEMGGGGLPSGRVSLQQARPGAPMRGVAEFAPYARTRSMAVNGSAKARPLYEPGRQ